LATQAYPEPRRCAFPPVGAPRWTWRRFFPFVTAVTPPAGSLTKASEEPLLRHEDGGREKAKIAIRKNRIDTVTISGVPASLLKSPPFVRNPSFRHAATLGQNPPPHPAKQFGIAKKSFLTA